MKALLIRIIKIYQVCISPLLGPRCRFYPSCSQYACEAVHHYGTAKGAWMTLQRLSRCHPLHAGGYDPLPEGERVNSERSE